MKKTLSLRAKRSNLNRINFVIDCFVTSLFALTLFFLFIASSLATPPTSIDLTYDQTKGSLHVEAQHPSFDINKSYVRLMNVYINGQEVSTLNYFKQNSPDAFSDDVPMTAKTGDVIKVELFCTLGGEMSQELTIT